MKPLRTAAVLGAGAVGRALRAELPRAGVKVVAAWTRSSGKPLPELRDAEVIFLAVPDGAVGPLCKQLQVQRGQLVVHLAGALPLKPLQPALRRGARTGSLHPLRAFVKKGPTSFAGAAAGLSGSDATARAQLAQLARRLGLMALNVRDESRALYHAAAVLAAGCQVALFSEAQRAFRKATRTSEPASRAALLPLSLGALEKLRHAPAARALTGPVVRGDTGTIAAHRKALPGDLLPLYDLLTRISQKMVPVTIFKETDPNPKVGDS